MTAAARGPRRTARAGIAARLAVLGAFLLPVQPAAAPAGTAEQGDQDLHRLVAILDYIGADYGAAVAGDGVIDPFEHREQIAFARAARKIAQDRGDLPPGTDERLAELERLCAEAAPASEVTAITRSARRMIVEAFGLVQSPAAPPSRADGARLYESHCARCHGSDGVPPPEKVAELVPPPRALSDRSVLDPLSPYRVYNALSFGIEGTAMPSFETLGARERWDLAFHVFALRAEASPSRALVPEGLRAGLATLAAGTDADLRARLLEAGLDPDRAEPALDALRLELPYSPDLAEQPVAAARRLLDRGLEAAREGRPDAEGLLIDAYLDGVERIEAPLRSIDPVLAQQLEAAFLRLRAAVAGGSTDPAAEVLEVRRLLGRAEVRLESRPTGPWFGAASAAVLVVREGIEAALIVMLLLGTVAGAGAARYVHAGWIAALAAGAASFGAARLITSRLAIQGEIIEGVASLAAAAVLFTVSHWLIGQVQAATWLRFLKQRALAHLSSGGLVMLSGLTFLAVYREAFETILFFEALLSSGGSPGPVAAGALLGVIVLCAAIVVLKRLGNRLPVRTFFTISGIMLYALCVIFAGHGIRALVAAGILTPRPIPIPSIPLIGLYPDALVVATQGALLLAVLGSIAIQRRRGGTILVTRSSRAVEGS